MHQSCFEQQVAGCGRWDESGNEWTGMRKFEQLDFSAIEEGTPVDLQNLRFVANSRFGWQRAHAPCGLQGFVDNQKEFSCVRIEHLRLSL